MGDYDIYFRHAAVRGGEWTGFALAWKGLAGLSGLSARPHRRWRPWIPDPANPNDPAAGSWGVWQWHLDLALLPGLVGLMGVPPEDGRTPAEMRADLLAYLDLPAIELKDTDGVVYPVRITGYAEETAEPADLAHPEGTWLAAVDLAFVTL